MASLDKVFNPKEIKKHFVLTVELKFDIDNETINDLNSLNYYLTVKNRPRKELKQVKKLTKVLNKMQKSGWNITNTDCSVFSKE